MGSIHDIAGSRPYAMATNFDRKPGCKESPICRAANELPESFFLDNKMVWPSGNPDKLINCDMGPRNIKVRGSSHNHKGIDIRARLGDPIVAARGGEVVFAGRKEGYGNVVIVSHGNGLFTLYAHLSSFEGTKPGDIVEAGQEIGLAGNTGVGNGAHLHFEVILNQETDTLDLSNLRSATRIDPKPFFSYYNRDDDVANNIRYKNSARDVFPS